MAAGVPSRGDRRKAWTFLSNHAHVLLCLARDPNARLRDVATQVGITERGVHRIVGELEDGGVLARVRDGRRNRYELDVTAPLRHPLENTRTVGRLLEMLLEPREIKRLRLDRASRSRKRSST